MTNFKQYITAWGSEWSNQKALLQNQPPSFVPQYISVLVSTRDQLPLAERKPKSWETSFVNI